MSRRRSILYNAISGDEFEETVYILIIAGQSNASGQAVRADAPPMYQVEIPDVLMWNQTIASLSPQYLTLENNTNRVTCQPSYPKPTIAATNSVMRYGTEFPIGVQLSSHLGEQIRIVKWSLGGTKLAFGASEKDWSHISSNELYAEAVAATNAAKSDVVAEEKRPVVLGIVWIQGENDCYILADANNYQTNLSNWFASFKIAINEPNLKFFQNTIKTGTPGLTYTENVNVGKVNFTNADPVNRFLISSEGIESYLGDPIHFNAEGIEQLGTLFAEQIIATL